MLLACCTLLTQFITNSYSVAEIMLHNFTNDVFGVGRLPLTKGLSLKLQGAQNLVTLLVSCAHPKIIPLVQVDSI